MNLKAEKFQQGLAAANINCFQVEEMNDEYHSALFRTTMEVEGQKLPMIFVVDDSIYMVIGVQIAPKIKDENREAVMEMINQLNMKYKSGKYFINTDGELMYNASVVCGDEHFDFELVSALLDITVKNVSAEYPEMMKAMWA